MLFKKYSYVQQAKKTNVKTHKKNKKMLQWQASRYLILIVFVCPVLDFYQDFEEFEPPCRYQSDDGAAIRHQCLRHQPRGPLGVFPPGLCALRHLCFQSISVGIRR